MLKWIPTPKNLEERRIPMKKEDGPFGSIACIINSHRVLPAHRKKELLRFLEL